MMDRDNELHRHRNDLVWAVAVGVLVIGVVLYDVIRQIVELFASPDGITVRAPLPEQAITADIAGGIDATVDAATLTVADVNPVSVASLVLGAVLTAAGLITATALATMVCRRLLRGIVFDGRNTRLVTGASIALLAAALCDLVLRTMGLNGVFAAAGGEFDGQQQLFLEQLPLFGAAFAVGVIGIVFGRGHTLQKDTEGLV